MELCPTFLLDDVPYHHKLVTIRSMLKNWIHDARRAGQGATDESAADGGITCQSKRLIGNLSPWKLEIDAAERHKAPADRLRQVPLLGRLTNATFGKPANHNTHLDFWPIVAVPIMIDTRSSGTKPSRSNSAVTSAAVLSII